MVWLERSARYHNRRYMHAYNVFENISDMFWIRLGIRRMIWTTFNMFSFFTPEKIFSVPIACQMLWGHFLAPPNMDICAYIYGNFTEEYQFE